MTAKKPGKVERQDGDRGLASIAAERTHMIFQNQRQAKARLRRLRVDNIILTAVYKSLLYKVEQLRERIRSK